MLNLYASFYPNLYYQPNTNYGDHNSTIGFDFVEFNPGRILQEAYYEGDDEDDYFEED